MKQLYIILLMIFGSTLCKAQYFVATLNNEGNNLVFTIQPNPGGGDITTSVFNAEYFIRIPTTAPTYTVSTPELNTTDIPSLSTATASDVYVGANVQGSEAGFDTHWFNIVTGNNTTETTFLDGQEYELFRVSLDGDPGNMDMVDVDLVANTFFAPSYVNFTGTAGVLYDPLLDAGDPAANLFYNNTSSEAEGDGSTTLVESQAGVSLPITLRSFTASPYENRDANLNWITSSEINASHFVVERSEDGVEFVEIGQVAASGNSNAELSYTYQDRDVNVDRADVIQYYRLKLVDIDGKYEYSGIRAVNFTRSDLDFGMTIFPNPTTEYVQISLVGLDNTKSERPTLHVYDASGALVGNQELTSDLGNYDMTDLTSQVYYFVISYNGELYNNKIMKMK